MKRMFGILAVVFTLCVGAFGFAGCNGGTPELKFDSSKAIQVVCRPTTSGTRGAVRDLLEKKDRNYSKAEDGKTKIDLRKGIENPDKVTVLPTTAAVLSYVAGEPQAIGYDSNGFVDNTVKKLKVDGKECSIANIKDGSYFLSRPLRILYSEAGFTAGSIQDEFLKYLKSKDAQQKAESEGYVSASDINTLTAYTKNDAMTGSKVTLTGSTSLQPLMRVLADGFKTIYTSVTVDIGGSGSGDGYTCAAGGFATADFGMISDKERKTGANNGESAQEFNVANDGIAIIVNLKNTFTDITKAQLQDLFFVYDGSLNSPKVTDRPDTTAKTYASWDALKG